MFITKSYNTLCFNILSYIVLVIVFYSILYSEEKRCLHLWGGALWEGGVCACRHLHPCLPPPSLPASASSQPPASLPTCLPLPRHTLITQNTMEENRIHGLARNAQWPPTGSPGTPSDPPWIPQGHPKDAQGPPRDSPRRTKVAAPFTMWSCAEARKGASSQGA